MINGPFSFRIQNLHVKEGRMTWVDSAAGGFFSHFEDAYKWAQAHAGDEAFWRVVPYKPYVIEGLKAEKSTPDNVIQMPDPLDEKRGRVVLAFRDMLAMAERGEILDYVTVWVSPTDSEAISWRSETSRSVFQLLGAISVFRDHIARTILESKK